MLREWVLLAGKTRIMSTCPGMGFIVMVVKLKNVRERVPHSLNLRTVIGLRFPCQMNARNLSLNFRMVAIMPTIEQLYLLLDARLASHDRLEAALLSLVESQCGSVRVKNGPSTPSTRDICTLRRLA